MEFKPSVAAIKKPVTIYLLILLVAVVGWTAYQSLPREEDPDIQFPYLRVGIAFPGSSPMDVETQITNKLEPELQNLENLKNLYSTSMSGYASLTMEFILGTDIKDAKTSVREAVDRVKNEFPDDSEEAEIFEFNASDDPIVTMAISGDIGLITLRDIAEDIETDLKNVNGVDDVDISGGLNREVQVNIDPNKLQYYQVDINMVIQAIQGENTNIPGGKMQIGPMSYQVRIPGEIEKPEEINNMVLTYRDNSPIYVHNVATVLFKAKEESSRSRLNGKNGVTLDIIKKRGSNTTAVAEKVINVIESAKLKYSKSVQISILEDSSKDVKFFVGQLENNIIMGIILVFLVLLFFMGVKNAMLVGTAIPLSMLMSFAVLSWSGITLNIVVLFSLIVALGMLVDNAIVVVENIYRHIQSGKNKLDAAITGVSEVAMPVISSTLTTLLAFLPLIFLPGIMGEFLAYIPKTLIITLSCSLFVGLIFNPVMAATVMTVSKKKKPVDEVEQVKASKFLQKYSLVLKWNIKHPFLTLLMVAIFWGGAMTYYFMVSNPGGKKSEFFPDMEPRTVKIKVTTPPDVNLDQTDRLAKEVEQHLLSFNEYAENTTIRTQAEKSDLRLNFPDWEDRRGKFLPSEIMEKIRQSLPNVPGAKITLKKSGGGGPPSSNQAFNIELRGKNFNSLKQTAEDIESKIKGIKGMVNLDNSLESEREEIQVKLDRDKIAQYGLQTANIAALIRVAINGKNVSTYRIGQNEYDIVVRLDEVYRQYDEDLNNLHIATPSGESILLEELATIERQPAMGPIQHRNSERIVSIEADSSSGTSGVEILNEAKERLKDFQPPADVKISWEGENKENEETQAHLIQSFWIAVGLIFAVLVTQFNSLMLPFIIILSIFASLGGVFLGMSIHHQPISILIGGIGMVSLAGVVVNNAIVLIDYIRQLRLKGVECNEAIVIAGMVRLRPVILTAVTTTLGVLPIFLGVDIDFFRPFNDIIRTGSESGTLWYPMNLVMIYGLSIATFLTLFMVPTLYSLNEQSKLYFTKQFAWVKAKLNKNDINNADI